MSIYMWEDVCKKEHKLGFFMSMGHLQKTRGFFSNSCPTLDDLGIPPFHSPTCLAYVVLPGAGRQGATTKTGVGMVVSWRSFHGLKSGDQVLALCYLLHGE